MSFQTSLENLRAKPEHVRKRYAFWTSFGLTAIIFAFWIGSVTTLGQTSKVVVKTTVNKAGTPAQSLIAGVGTFVSDIKDLLFGPKKVIYSSVEVRAGKK